MTIYFQRSGFYSCCLHPRSSFFYLLAKTLLSSLFSPPCFPGGRSLLHKPSKTEQGSEFVSFFKQHSSSVCDFSFKAYFNFGSGIKLWDYAFSCQGVGCGVGGVGWGGWLTGMSVLFLYRAHSKVSHFDSEALSVVNRFSGTTILMETRRLCVKSRSDIGVSISRSGWAHIANKWGLHERRVYSSEALGKLLTIHTLQT